MKPVFSDNIFRGYDIRAKIPEELNEAGAYVLGKSYAAFLAKRRINEAVVSGDNRLHTPMIKTAFIKGLIDSGINVIDNDLGLVYFMYFAQYYYQSKGGAFISASHNPKEYNGFKLAVGFSDTMVTEEVKEFQAIAKSGKFIKAKIKGKLIRQAIFPAYKKDLLKRFPQQLNFTVVVDTACSTPGKFMPEILRSAGCAVIAKNTGLDGNFPLGTPDPTETEYLERLGKEVTESRADIGFCYDADGDRVGLVDNRGTLVYNDVLTALFAQDVLDFLPGSPIIYNALCSKLVADTIIKAKGIPIMWQVGHSFIKAKVKETRAPFGGEPSGHFFFMDNFYGHDDGAYATLRLLNYLSRKKLTLKQAVALLPQYISSPEIKLGLSDKIKFSFVKNVIGPELKQLYPQDKITEIDGTRIDTPDAMAIIRASQNGPYLTIKFEGRTVKQYQKLKSELKLILRSHAEIDWSYGVNVEALK